MNFLNCCYEAWCNITNNKIRSFLTTIGIVIGIASLVTINSVGLSFRFFIRDRIGQHGSSLIWVQNNQDQLLRFDHYKTLDDRDIDFFIHAVDGCTRHSPFLTTDDTVSYKSKKQNVRLIGVSPDYFSMFLISMEKGNVFSMRDISLRKKICVLRPDIAEILFGDSKAVGNKIKIFGKLFTVAGITTKLENRLLNDGTDNLTVFIPFNVHPVEEHDRYVLQFESSDYLERVIDTYQNYLNTKYGLYFGETFFKISKADSIINLTMKILNIINTIMAIVSGIALFVGGLGIMNILIVSVDDHIREIGIRLAVGASKDHIFLQYIAESVIISLIGGVIGMIIGLGGSIVFCLMLSWPFRFAGMIMLFTFLLSFSIGIIFGLLPSFRASGLTPITALRTYD